jgi:iron complex outermembrane receptor protein
MKKSTLRLNLLLFGFLVSISGFSQKMVSGKVTSGTDGSGLVAAAVSVKGTTVGVITDDSGKYSIQVPTESTTLEFSYTGFITQEISIGDKSVIDVVLEEGVQLSDIVVIGSRSQTRTKIESAVPVDIIPMKLIVNDVGQVDLNQILTFIAPSFQSARQTISDGTDHIDPAQLRGLGSDQVLVLVNGKRRHQSALVNVNGTVNRGQVGTDLNAIPANSIERVEILRDGAAAQYGSDAIAGVINIVLKKETGVLNGNVSYGQHITSYAKNYVLNKGVNDEVNARDGAATQVALNYGFKLGSKGILNLTGEYTQRDITSRTGTYTGQIYPSVGGLVKDDSILAARGLDRNDFDMRIGNSKISGGGVVFNLEMPLSDNTTFYAFGGFNRKSGEAAGFYRYPNAVPAAVRGLVLSNSFYPNGFLPLINSTVTDFSTVAGLRGKFGEWNYDISNTYGRNDFDFDITNSINYTQALVSSNPQTIFDAGGLTFLQNTINADVSRSYKVLSGLNTAFGAEYRIDQFDIRAGEESSYKNYNTASAVAAGSQVFAGFLPSNEGSNARNNVALYADFEQDFTKNFMVAGALRFENYSDFGSTFNYKLASRLKLSDFLSLRASTSTGFRAPSQQQKYYAKTNTLFVSTPAGLVPVESGTFTNDSEPAKILGIPELKQETSVSYTLGATARIADNLELTVDAYQIDINDRIVLTNNFTSGGNATLKAKLDAANAGAANFFSNAVDTRARGIESVLNYTKRINSKSDIRFTLAGTFIKNEVVKDAAGKPIIKASPILVSTGQVGSYFNREDQSRIEVANPQSKLSAMLNYRNGKFSSMLRMVRFGEVTYLDPTINPDKPDTWPVNALTNQKQTLDQVFSPKVTTDVTVSYDFSKGLTFTLGGNNIFDVYQDIHTHSGNFSLGRFVYSRRVQQFGFNGAYFFARIRFSF